MNRNIKLFTHQKIISPIITVRKLMKIKIPEKVRTYNNYNKTTANNQIKNEIYDVYREHSDISNN